MGFQQPAFSLASVQSHSHAELELPPSFSGDGAFRLSPSPNAKAKTRAIPEQAWRWKPEALLPPLKVCTMDAVAPATVKPGLDGVLVVHCAWPLGR